MATTSIIGAVEGYAGATPVTDPIEPTSLKAGRVVSLDVTKGALVLVMVLYHWMNYFIGLHSDLYRYLRFLTPSFIFVTGFLVARVYIPRVVSGGRDVPRRLILRGLKLLAIVLVLNILIGFASKASLTRLDLSPVAWVQAYLTGLSPVAFSVLMPIGYLLVFCGSLLASDHFQAWLLPVCVVLIGASEVCELLGRPSGYLEVFSIGILGIALGRIQLERLYPLFRGVVILSAYFVYLAAIHFWNATYLLQIAGVCINIGLLCWLARSQEDGSTPKRILIRLGEYSLFAYISQILILQCIHKGAQALGPGFVPSYSALLLGFVLTACSVQAIHWAKHRVRSVRRAYSAVFG